MLKNNEIENIFPMTTVNPSLIRCTYLSLDEFDRLICVHFVVDTPHPVRQWAVFVIIISDEATVRNCSFDVCRQFSPEFVNLLFPLCDELRTHKLGNVEE